ncbi:P-type DNA transfer ATPase VirB11 [Arcobacter defluvii]|uniref:P-type DNA transfer ATPase VirB11 n=1 Tax=Arcobacter defluvii TaxID=873191 RepID=UPI00155D9C4E|nr:P-type DNA transfer ATPase VirB11 [Arcobacter defluvii]
MSRSLKIQTESIFGDFLADDSINEICANGDGSIWTQDYNGIWEEHKKEIPYKQMLAFAVPVASHKEDTIKANKPILSATLNNGERVQIVVPPVTKKDMLSITIRKPSKTRYTIEDYEKQGIFSNIIHEDDVQLTLDEVNLSKLYNDKKYKEFITEAVRIGKNIVIAGATGSGKTTFMKSLIDFIPLEERLITIEDTEEIVFYKHKNHVQLFYPSEAKEGDPVTSAILLKSCLRMKPNRILLAELRSGEAYDYLNVLNSGHGGSITSLHAGSVRETFTRLSLMILQNPQGQKLPFEIIQKNLNDVIDIVVHIQAHNGKRNISDIYYKGAKDEKYK